MEVPGDRWVAWVGLRGGIGIAGWKIRNASSIAVNWYKRRKGELQGIAVHVGGRTGEIDLPPAVRPRPVAREGRAGPPVRLADPTPQRSAPRSRWLLARYRRSHAEVRLLESRKSPVFLMLAVRCSSFPKVSTRYPECPG